MDIETLTSILKAELGDILEMEEVCPCVFYVAAFDIDASLPCTCEYYVVRDNASMLSNKAKAYGRELSAAPELLIYPWSKDDSGWRIVKYEANLYLHKKGKLPDAEEELRDDIAFGREFHPDYFGCYPLPAVTPWGASVCYVELDAGIFWIVTRQRKELLCVLGIPSLSTADRFAGFAVERDGDAVRKWALAPAQEFPTPFRFRLRRKLHYVGNSFAFDRGPLRWVRSREGRGMRFESGRVLHAQEFPTPLRFRLRRKLRYVGNSFAFRAFYREEGFFL